MWVTIWCEEGQHMHRQWAWVSPSCESPVGHRWEWNCGHTALAWLLRKLQLLSTKTSSLRAVLSCHLWPGGVCSCRVGSSQPGCWSGFPILTVSSFSICLLGLHWCSLLSFMLHKGTFLTWPLTQRLAQKQCFSVEHEKQQGRAKHLWFLGKTWQVVRSRILCTLNLNVSDEVKGQME